MYPWRWLFEPCCAPGFGHRDKCRACRTWSSEQDTRRRCHSIRHGMATSGQCFARLHRAGLPGRSRSVAREGLRRAGPRARARVPRGQRGLRRGDGGDLAPLAVHKLDVGEEVVEGGRGGPGTSTTVVELYIFNALIRTSLPGIASAASVLLFLVSVLLIFPLFSARRRAREQEE